MGERVAAVLDEDAHSARSACVNRTQQCFAVGACMVLDLPVFEHLGFRMDEACHVSDSGY